MCLFTSGPRRQVRIQGVLGATQVLGFELWNRADLRESQNELSDCLGQQRVENMGKASVLLPASLR